MKVLQLSQKTFYPPKDGGSKAAYHVGKGLAQNGCDVYALTINSSKHYVDVDPYMDELSEFKVFESVYHNTDVSSAKMVRNLFFSDMPYNYERFLSDYFAERINLYLRKENFDFVLLEGLYMAMYYEIVKKTTDTPIIMRAHNVESEIWDRVTKAEKNPFKKIYFKILKKRVERLELSKLNAYDAIVPITKRDKAKFIELGCRIPTYTVPFGYDGEIIDKVPEKLEYPSLFYIGSLDWLPNIEGLLWFFLNIWPALKKKYPKLKFHVAGRNAAPETVRMIRDHEAIYHGEVPSSTEFMSDKSIMITPIFSGSGMRVKIIEGMARCKAIVTTTIGAEGIDVEDSKNIMVADTTSEFIKKTEKLITDFEFYKSVCENAAIFIRKNFDNVNIIKGFVEFLEKLRTA
jgi:glycosyltransferase involved in cell wall biosynthesis